MSVKRLCALTPESQSNLSSQSDSGVSEMASSGHTRSQSVVSSIFSDAWRRGTQGEVHTHTPSCPFPVTVLVFSDFISHNYACASLPEFKGEEIMAVPLCAGGLGGGS